MRLINAKTYGLEEFANDSEVQYAILSHRWAEEEVSFDDMQSLDDARKKKGFSKIEGSCQEALRGDLKYVWVDTCCINKNSSAELSEAINSMFRWYQNAQVCYAYLSDVGTHEPEILEQFVRSGWFERGWTLQELLAPAKVLFYNQAWSRFGSKNRLVNEVYQASLIPAQAILGTRSIFTYSLAERMQWAAKRITTRPEDRAYSLMGLFGVNMPMLYGEGGKAFFRLQEEIIKHSDDQSIFAWSGLTGRGSGLLALSPNNFGANTQLTMPDTALQESEPYTMTNKGLAITLSMTPWNYDIYFALLSCIPVIDSVADYSHYVGVFLQRTTGKQFRRVAVTEDRDVYIVSKSEFDATPRGWRSCSIYVQQSELSSQIPRLKPHRDSPIYGIKLLPIPGAYMAKDVSSPGKWDAKTGIARLNPGQSGCVAIIDLQKQNESLGYIKVGFGFDFQPRFVIARDVAHAKTDLSTEFTDWSGRRNVWSIDFAEAKKWTPIHDASKYDLYPIDPNVYLYAMPVGKDAVTIDLKKHNSQTWGIGESQGQVEIFESNTRGRKIWTLRIDLRWDDRRNHMRNHGGV